MRSLAVWDAFVLTALLNKTARDLPPNERSGDRFFDATLSAVPSLKGERPVPVFLAVREPDSLVAAAQGASWEARHGDPYAYATGAVAVQAEGTADHGFPLYIPRLDRPDSTTPTPVDLAIDSREIWFGPSMPDYAVAGTDHSFYSFEGIKFRGNAILHVRSRNFDEPIGVRLAAESETVVTIHGCRGMEEHIYIGGRHTCFKEIVRKKLSTATFAVLESTRFPGLSRGNICNRCRGGRGVQLEISAGMRRSLFQDISRLRRKEVTAACEKLVATLRDALGELSAVPDESH